MQRPATRLQEARHGLPVPPRARGIVGVTDEDHLGALVDGRKHGLGVETEIPERHETNLQPQEYAHPLVDREGFISGDDVVACPAKGLDDAADDLARAVTHQELLRVLAEFLGQGVAQIEAVSVGIESGAAPVEALQNFPGGGGRTQRILVVIASHQPIDAVEAHQFRVGPAWRIGREAPDVVRDEAQNHFTRHIGRSPDRLWPRRAREAAARSRRP